MDARKLLDVLLIAERLKDTTRHCYTAKGRHESVAEHSWMMTLMAFFMRDEFKEVDMDKVIRMCIIHDLGECFTGDIPAFDKNEDHEKMEEELVIDRFEGNVVVCEDRKTGKKIEILREKVAIFRNIKG